MNNNNSMISKLVSLLGFSARRVGAKFELFCHHRAQLKYFTLDTLGRIVLVV